MTIRPAVPDDVPEIALLGEQFHREAAVADIAEFVTGDFEKTLHHLIESEDGILLIADEDGEVAGMAGGLCFPFYFNHSHRTGQEFFWFVRKGLRNGIGAKLLTALESEARANGCQSWAMIALANARADTMDRFYVSRGYRPTERGYIKRL